MSEAKIRITAKDDTSSAFKTAAANINSLKAGAGGLADSFAAFAGLTGGLSVAGLVAFTKSAIDSIDALNDVADATGASIENISALEDVAARTGTKFETVTSALVKFNSILNSATPESGAAAALKAIGLEADNLKALDPAEALRQTAVALSRFSDDGDKARIVQVLFGKSVKEAAPFLKDLAEQTRLVGTVTKEQAAEAEKFNKELSAMQKNISDVARDLAGPLVTAINQSIERFKKGASEGKNFYTVIREEQLRLLGLNTTTQDYADQLSTVNARLASSNPSISTRNKLLEQQAALMAKLVKPAFAVGNAGRGNVNPDPVKPTVGNLPPEPKKVPAGSKTDPEAEAKRYLETLQRQLDKTQDLTISELALKEIQSGRLGAASDDTQAKILALATQLDGEKKLTEALNGKRAAATEAGDAVNKSNEEYQALLGRLLTATPSFNLEKQRADVKLLTEEFEAGRISEELYLEAVSARLDLVVDKTEKAKTTAEQIEYAFTNAFKGMEDSLVSFVTTGKLDFADLANSIIADMVRIAIQQSITAPLVASAKAIFAGTFASGGAFDGGVQAFAKGGTFTNSIVDSPTLFKFAKGTGLMGEAGPEAIMPLSRGADGKLGVAARGVGGGSSVIVNVIESPGQGGQQSRRSENGVDMIDVFVEKIKSSIAGDISRGSGAVPAALSRNYGLNRVAGAY